MNSKGLYSDVLKPFSDLLDIFGVVIPAQACFYRNGQMRGIYDRLGHCYHFVNIL
jgi:hypothetical protein